MKRSRRLKAFNAALPDAIDLMARSLVAGHSIGSSIEMIAEQSPEPLAFEFVQVYQQQRLGLHFRDALLQMGSRIPSRDLQFLITAILVQKETGGDLTEILARAAHVIRDRVRIEGEVRTRTAQGRLTGWILGLLPVIMLVLINIVSPGYSDILFHDPLGQKLLYAGGAYHPGRSPRHSQDRQCPGLGAIAMNRLFCLSLGSTIFSALALAVVAASSRAPRAPPCSASAKSRTGEEPIGGPTR